MRRDERYLKKKDYSSLDAAILALVSQAPRAKDAILAEGALRRLALHVYRPRAGESPAQSTDRTIMDRLNKMRIAGRLAYDPGTSRWTAGAVA